MEQLSVRALSRQTAAALDRVEKGETIEIKRGNKVVAIIEPARTDQNRKLQWKEHIHWLLEASRSSRRARKDPVDELLLERGHRNPLR